MIIKPLHFFRTLFFFQKSAIALMAIAIMSLSLSFVSFLFLQKQLQKEENQSVKKEIFQKKTAEKSYSLESFVLGKEFATFFDKDLRCQLLYLGKNTRPDKTTSYRQAFIALPSSEKTLLIEEGSKVFFAYEKGDLTFSESPTPFWIRIQKISEELLFEARVVVAMEDPKEILEENYKIQLAKNQNFIEKDQENYLQSLLEIKWIEPDRLIEQYGGDSYVTKKGCYRLFTRKNSADFVSVKIGDLLIFDKGCWRAASKNEDLSSYPIAQVESSAPGKLDLRVWDKSGKKEDLFSYFLERQPSLNLRMDEVFTNIRQRGQERVTCKMGNKTTLLKTGDWIIKLRNQWKILRDPEEIARYLGYGIQAEMFVFDGIEKTQTEVVFKGHLFDKLRTQSLPIKIALQKSRKELSKKKNKLLEGQETAFGVETSEEANLDEDEIDNLEEDADDEELLRITGMNE